MKEENWKKNPTKTQTNRKYKHISEAVRFSWCEMFLLCCVFFTLHIRSTFSSYSLSAFNMALSTFQPSGCLIHSLDNLSESGRFVKAFLNWISRLSLNVSCFVSFFLDPFLMEVSDPMEYLHLLFGPPLNSTDNVTNFIFSFCKWKKVLILNKWCIFFFITPSKMFFIGLCPLINNPLKMFESTGHPWISSTEQMIRCETV